MKNTGTLVANDMRADRQKATVANMHRLGVRNAVVCVHDGRAFPGVMGGFQRVLLDAPCSGLGVISRDPTVKLQRKVADIAKMAHLQKELILCAIDSLADPEKKNGSQAGGAGACVVVYSTCSVAVEENEAVVQYALEKRHVKVGWSQCNHSMGASLRSGT